MTQFRAALISIIRRYRLDFRSNEWKGRLIMAEQGLLSENTCKMLLPCARAKADEIEDKGLLLWRPPDKDELNADGEPDIELGSLVEGDKQRFGIKFKDRPRNVLAMGGAGGGKSVLGRGICVKVDELNQHCPGRITLLIIIDPKPDYLDMKRTLKGKVRLFSWKGNLRLGLNGPVDVPASIWIGQLTICIAARIGLMVSRIFLAGLISRLLVALNPGLMVQDLDDASVTRDLIWPPLKMVLEVAKKKEVLETYSSKADYGKTMIMALEGLIHDSGSLFDCCNGLNLNNLIKDKCHMVFNVSNAPPYIRNLITDVVINQVMVRKIHLNYKCDHTDEIFILEESDLLLESDVTNFSVGLSPLDTLHRLGRELGLMSITSISGI